jgi:hypothetical protein
MAGLRKKKNFNFYTRTHHAFSLALSAAAAGALYLKFHAGELSE